MSIRCVFYESRKRNLVANILVNRPRHRIFIRWRISQRWRWRCLRFNIRTCHTHTHTRGIMLVDQSIYSVGTCESFFSFESNLESNRSSDSFSNRIDRLYHASRNRAWRTAGVAYRPIICWRLALWTNESDVHNWVLVHFNSVLKRVTQCSCTLI